MNAQAATRGNMLYLWGGLVELGAVETTLDDLWALNMSKIDVNRPEWACLWRGTAKVESEEEDAPSSDEDDDDADEPPSDESDLSDSDDETEGEEAAADSAGAPAVALEAAVDEPMALGVTPR
jgi:hypothetical protein